VTEESEAFEQLNERISRLINTSDTKVEWDADIPDPDSVDDKRQIDILITSADGAMISVECRNRSSAQSVMWIEELIGRKLSQKLDGMIAVSMNGFSALARTKARKYGIVLYDFDQLDDSDIASWGSVVQIEAKFVQFSKLEIRAAIPKGSEVNLHPDPAATKFTHGSMDGFASVQDALRDDVLLNPNIGRIATLDPSGYAVDGIPIIALSCSYVGRDVSMTASCTYVALMDAPGVKRSLRSTEVQRFEHSVREILLHNGQAHMQVDVSKLSSPDNSILHELTVKFPARTTVTQYELVGDRQLLSKSTTLALNIGVA
jgi:hypothetical protein